MVFVFGTRFLGGVKSYNGQDIQTKFAHFCFIPLFPVAGDSLLVTESGFRTRQGIYMKMNGTSVLAAYARIPLAILTVVCFCYGNEVRSLSYTVLSVVLALLSVYMFFFFGRSTAAENEERELIGRLTGVYAKADWISHGICDTMYMRLDDAYTAAGRNWKADLNHGVVVNAEMTYVLALLNHALMTNEESRELKEKAKAFYERMTVSSVEAAVAN